MECLLEASLCFDHWYNVNFNCNLCKFSDKFLYAFSMRSFVLWVDTILLNWIQWILLFPILSDSIFVIFITHRLLTLPTLLIPFLTRQLRHSQLEPILWFIWYDVLIPITLPWDTNFVLNTFGRNYTSAWRYPTKVHLINFVCMRHWLYTAMESVPGKSI